MSAILVCVLMFSLTGCGKSSDASKDGGKPADSGVKTSDSAAKAPDTQTGPAKSIAQGYGDYAGTKGNFIGRLSDGLEDQPAASMELLGVVLVELYVAPIVGMGVDEAYARTVLNYFSLKDIQYTGAGNRGALTFTNAEGVRMVCEATYDAAKDALTAKVTEADKDPLIFEYTRTSYGYASQYSMKTSDGTYSIYKGTFYGKDGVLGLTDKASAQPSSIVGVAEVAKTFPKDCDSWFEINGTRGTGKASDGATFEFTAPD